MDVRVGLWRRLSAEELMLLNCGVGEDSWESLGLQGDPTIHSEGDQPWDFFGRNDAKAETPVLWPPHAKSWLIWNDSDAGRDWRQEVKGTIEDEMAGGRHWLDGHESEWTPEVCDGQGGLACCDSWGCKESNTTKWLNWTELKYPDTLSLRSIVYSCFKFLSNVFFYSCVQLNSYFIPRQEKFKLKNFLWFLGPSFPTTCIVYLHYTWTKPLPFTEIPTQP